MMNDPEGDLYKRCFDRLNDFNKKRSKKGGKVFENAMRKSFDEIMDTEPDSC